MGLKAVAMTKNSRPLLVTDCDEVILHMIAPFADWLDEEHAIDVNFGTQELADMLTHRDTGDKVDHDKIWPLFKQFFGAEMHRQFPFPGAVEALQTIARNADVVVLTNTGSDYQELRTEQLAGHGLPFRVVANSGPKGPPLADLIAEYDPSVAIFIDDLSVHIKGASEHAPTCWRLQMVGEPKMAGRTRTSSAAHARIDAWDEALPWIMDKFNNPDEAPAPISTDQDNMETQ